MSDFGRRENIPAKDLSAERVLRRKSGFPFFYGKTLTRAFAFLIREVHRCAAEHVPIGVNRPNIAVTVINIQCAAGRFDGINKGVIRPNNGEIVGGNNGKSAAVLILFQKVFAVQQFLIFFVGKFAAVFVEQPITITASVIVEQAQKILFAFTIHYLWAVFRHVAYGFQVFIHNGLLTAGAEQIQPAAQCFRPIALTGLSRKIINGISVAYKEQISQRRYSAHERRNITRNIECRLHFFVLVKDGDCFIL